MSIFDFFKSGSGNPLLDKVNKLSDELEKLPPRSPQWEKKAKELDSAVYKERDAYLRGKSIRPWNDGEN